MKPTTTTTYARLNAELESIYTFLKGIYDFEPQSDHYVQWKENEITHWTEQLKMVNKKIDAKLEQIPFEIIWDAIHDHKMSLNIADTF